MRIRSDLYLFSFLIIAFLTITVFPQQMKHKMKSKMMPKITKAICVVHPTKGYEAHGIVTFTKVDNGIKVVADIEGLKPGEHGFHIHEKKILWANWIKKRLLEGFSQFFLKL